MGYSSPFPPSVKMRTLLAFAVALAATTAIELTKTNNGGKDRAIYFRPAPEDISYGYRGSDGDGYTNFGYDIIGSYFSPSYEDDSSEDTGYADLNSGYFSSDEDTDIYEDNGEEVEVQILDNGQEDGLSQEHMLSRRSPQDPNALYQIPLFTTLGKTSKKVGKKDEQIKKFSKGGFGKLGKFGAKTAKLSLKFLPLGAKSGKK